MVGVRVLGLFAGLGLTCSATCALAEVGASISVSSDDRFRGHSVSDGRPVATLDVSYDDVSGVYFGGAVDTVIAPEKPDLLSIRANLGYARRLRSGVTLDTGVVRANYTRAYTARVSAHYTDIYLGIVTDHVTAHVHYSPDYFRPGASTIYTDVDAVVRPAENWRFTGHVGALVQVAGPNSDDGRRTSFDWRLGIVRRVGALNLQLAWSGRVNDDDYHDGYRHGRSAFTAEGTYSF